MFIDGETRRDLNLDELLHVVQPLTAMGIEAKRNFQPFVPGQETKWQAILDEQELIQQACSSFPLAVHRIETILHKTPDVAFELEKLAGEITPSLTEWYRLKQFCWQVRAWAEQMQEMGIPASLHLDKTEIVMCEQLLWTLNPTPPLQSSFAIVDEYDEQLKKNRYQVRLLERERQTQREQIAESLETTYGMKRNRLGEWVVARGSSLDQQLQQDVRCVRIRETMYDAIYGLQTEMDVTHADWVDAIQREIERLEQEVCDHLADEFRTALPSLQKWLGQMAHFDLQWARVKAGRSWQGVRPQFCERELTLHQAFHPVMKQQLVERGGTIIPIDCIIQAGVTVIMGPNMGGKTIALKTVGIVVTLAQYGLFVPAVVCRMPLFPWVASVIGDYQDAEQGLSSFGAEVARLQVWMAHQDTGLLLLDEIGRGTNPREGTALAQAITQHLMDSSLWTIHVTHYQEVIEMARGYRVAGLDLAKAKEIPLSGEGIHSYLQACMDYRLIPLREGDQIPQQAIAIAEALQLDAKIIADAKKRMNTGGSK